LWLEIWDLECLRVPSLSKRNRSSSSSRQSAPRALDLRFRQIHLDFHTGPWIGDVGRDFDPAKFARVMKDAHVDSVTVFAKCHHGHLYYNTARPERHPGLKPGLDLLAEQVEALHGVGIRAPIYISVLCDEYAANTHPQWIALDPEGKRVGRPPLSNQNSAWQILDMSSPYQDFLADQTAEILAKFKPVDGIFFDMCWDQPSVSNFAKAQMRQWGLDPASESDRLDHARRVALDYMKRFYEMVKRSSPQASVFFNGRGHGNLRQEMPWQTQHEIESLPTGGWGYMYFPKNVRAARTLMRPYLGMTARFHKSWADFGGLKPYPALEYETSQMIANGARCSIGDQMHPRGILDPAAYERIGRAYARIEAGEPWLRDAEPVTQIAVLQDAQRKVGQGAKTPVGAIEGAVRMLTQLKHQFDIVDRLADLSKYELLILPDHVRVDDALAGRIRAHLNRGRALLASGLSGLSEDGSEVLLPELGIQAHGMSPFQTTYIRFGQELSVDVPASDHVMYERGVRVTIAAMRGRTRGASSAAKFASVVEPYFDRAWDHFSSHFQTPPDKLTKYAAAVQNGRVGYVSYPIFTAFALHGSTMYRLLVRNLLERLLPDPLLRVDGPTTMEATIMRQRGKGQQSAGRATRSGAEKRNSAARGGRTIVHLLQYAPERRTERLDLIEDIVPIFDIPLSLKLDRPPKRVYSAPDGKPIAFEYLAGRVNLRVPEIRGAAMVVFE
jgi:hypothetical protein